MYSIETKNLVINKLIENIYKNKIASDTNVSIGTIHNWSKIYKNNINNKISIK